jgi:Flp pilus assembly protein TadB
MRNSQRCTLSTLNISSGRNREIQRFKVVSPRHRLYAFQFYIHICEDPYMPMCYLISDFTDHQEWKSSGEGSVVVVVAVVVILVVVVVFVVVVVIIVVIVVVVFAVVVVFVAVVVFVVLYYVHMN